MCDPISITSAVLGIAQAGAGLMGQQAQADAIAAQNAEQAENIRVASIANYDQLERRRQQEAAAAGQKTFESNIQMLKATETAKLAAGEAGVSGGSVDRVVGELYGQGARHRDSVAQNFENTNFEINNAKENVSLNAQSQLNSLPFEPTPDYLGGLLSAGSSIFGAYEDYSNRQSKL